MQATDPKPLKPEVQSPHSTVVGYQMRAHRERGLILAVIVGVPLLCAAIVSGLQAFSPECVTNVKVEVVQPEKPQIVRDEKLGGDIQYRPASHLEPAGALGCYYAPDRLDRPACEEEVLLPYERLELAGFRPHDGDVTVLGCIMVRPLDRDWTCRLTGIHVPFEELKRASKRPTLYQGDRPLRSQRR